MDKKEITAAVEAILFASGDPVPAERIGLALGVDTEEILDCAEDFAKELVDAQRGIRLVRLGKKLQLCSAPAFADDISHALEQRKPPRLTNPALEVLSVVAYFQPVTRAYIDKMRGVDSSYTVSVLSERGLIEPCGRLEAPGRPLLYRTSDIFLRTMGVRDLKELPKLPDIGTSEGMAELRAAIDALSGDKTEQLVIEEEKDAE